MKATLWIAAACTVVAVGYFAITVDRAVGEYWSMLDRYCIDCHNNGELAGGVSFADLLPDQIHRDAQVWEAALRKLNGGLMPPPGEPRPAPSRLAGFASWLEQRLDAAAAANPNPGAPALHRLNRAEYANAIRDLLALPVDASIMLPADDSSDGFDNIANALSISPAHMQAYVASAAKISRLAIGDPTVSPAMTTYQPARGELQTDHIEGMPLGTRGGLQVRHVFPLDAEYEISVSRAGRGLFLPTVGGDEDLEITLDGRRVQLIPNGEPTTLRLRVSAGPHEIGAGLIVRRKPYGVDDLYSVHAGMPGIRSVAVMGPFDATGPGDTPSRRRIFICRAQSSAEEPACAKSIVQRLASRAFRRAVDDADRSLQTLMEFYQSGHELRGFEAGIQYALARILVDPQFVFRLEREPDSLPVGSAYELGDYELASRLSFFLWSSIPDDELLALAAEGRLSEPQTYESQARRMLGDARARALVDNFAEQWLSLRALDTVNPTATQFDGTLRQSMQTESKLFFTSIIDEDRSVVDLLDANYTFVDERLARHYGIPNIRGSQFRRVSLSGSRRGLLGHASILTATSAPNRTSPVKRGAWILENILGTPAPSPPPGVETDIDQTAPSYARGSTMRERLERHREDPACAACHNLIDPLGFALENFDAIGQWRAFDDKQPVDPVGELWDGTLLDGPEGLRSALMDRQRAFVMALTEKLLTYALGRAVDYYDMPAVRRIIRDTEGDDHRFSALVLGIVRSVPFKTKLKEPAPAALNLGAD